MSAPAVRAVNASLLDADHVAAMLGVSKDWVYAEVRGNRIPHVRLGRYVRFRAESIELWLSELERGTISPNNEMRGRAAGTTARMAPGG